MAPPAPLQRKARPHAGLTAEQTCMGSLLPSPQQWGRHGPSGWLPAPVCFPIRTIPQLRSQQGTQTCTADPISLQECHTNSGRRATCTILVLHAGQLGHQVLGMLSRTSRLGFQLSQRKQSPARWTAPHRKEPATLCTREALVRAAVLQLEPT